MKTAANASKKAPPPEQFPTGDEETTSGMVFTMKRKVPAAFNECSFSAECAPSTHVVSIEGHPPPQDMVVIQEGQGESSRGPNLWDPNLDISAYLEETLLLNEEKEKLDTHTDVSLLHNVMRQLGQALAAGCLATSKVKRDKQWRKETPSTIRRKLQSCKGSSNMLKLLSKRSTIDWSR